MTALSQLRDHSIVVADTGDIEQIKRFQPQDATTNPSLILAAIESGKYDALVTDALTWAQNNSHFLNEDTFSLASDRLIVLLGKEISSVVPGVVSTEVNAKLSFDTEKTVAKALFLIEQYASIGISKDKVLIKIAATWEGIQAARILEQQGIKCNLTLIFNFHQALACAQAGAFLISPFVGRILDWYKNNTGQTYSHPCDDPGVQSVRDIYTHFKEHGYPTIVMGASFRNTGEILYLSGCDRLTIGPSLLAELDAMDNLDDFFPAITTAHQRQAYPEATVTETSLRWALNEDPMATEKLADGIRVFAKAQDKLEQLLMNWSK
ncbi:transaldolase [Maribrevibacterium harenarium]|uniref:Transaldolase n=1 Tax=Maribrevibacterium harenarium TaxID=2589817 RepID=A0A501X3C0_9GAMM|nr:transaldolase [Maribrevibacterium harenarium]TPE54979.1 transaldolase [Maribrevibacterium harenarium]